MSADEDQPAEAFDYVIVGAGAAGAILANRLTEDGTATVCLLEAGPPDWHPYLHMPAGYIKAVFNPTYAWQFNSEPNPLTLNRKIPLPQGRTLGGSTSINGLVYNRGQREDFDGWAASGNAGWSYAEVLPYFMRNERREGGDSRYRGREGPQPVSAVFHLSACPGAGGCYGLVFFSLHRFRRLLACVREFIIVAALRGVHGGAQYMEIVCQCRRG